jgi:hypothetical protein
MLPTLWGRIQTRLVLLAVLGGFIVLILTPVLPLGVSFGHKYQITYTVLFLVAFLGIFWELLYHFVMQWRWEKDWPTLFGLLTGIPEGLLIWVLLLSGIVPGVDDLGILPSISYWFLFWVIWLAVWVVSNGPLRVLSIHWRFRGGRFV